MPEINIIPLLKERYTGHALPFDYSSEIYFDVRIRDTRQGFSVDFVRMPFPVPKQKTDELRLFEPHWEMPEGYGVFDEDRLIAVLEVTPETWNNRLRVTTLWVDREHRREGIATELMDKAKRLMKARGHRAIVLETQTSNTGAIAFYFQQGFTLAGFDAYAYTNEDIEKKEVRLEMIYREPRVSYEQP